MTNLEGLLFEIFENVGHFQGQQLLGAFQKVDQ
jgi:hypothetical protein